MLASLLSLLQLASPASPAPAAAALPALATFASGLSPEVLDELWTLDVAQRLAPCLHADMPLAVRAAAAHVYGCLAASGSRWQEALLSEEAVGVVTGIGTLLWEHEERPGAAGDAGSECRELSAVFGGGLEGSRA